MTKHRLLALVTALAAVLIAGLAWYLLRPAPRAVDINRAADVADTGAAATAGSPAATTAEIAGTWTVDRSIGRFSVADTTGTFVGFRIDEQLSRVGATEAVGRTPGVAGTLTIDGAQVTSTTITADLAGIVSDEARRENAIQRALGTSTEPTASFELSEPVALGRVEQARTLDVDAIGQLTLHGVTRTVTVPLQAQWRDDVITVTGSLPVALSDFNVTAPSAPFVVSVADTATVELQLYLTRA